MTVVIPFFRGDKPQAIQLAEWIRDLGNVSGHDCLLCVSRTTDPIGVIEPLQECFRKVSAFVPHEEATARPGTMGQSQAATRMWKATAWFVHYKIRQPWLWLETDAIPMRPTWLKEIDEAYRACRKPFMGTHGANIALEMMNGVAVYPPEVCEYSTDALMCDETPWDLAGGKDFVRHGHFSPLFQHVYFTHGEIPTFPRDAAILKPEAALFHRNKDGTLIQYLRYLGGATRAESQAGGSQSADPARLAEDKPPAQSTPDYIQRIKQHAKGGENGKEKENERQEGRRETLLDNQPGDVPAVASAPRPTLGQEIRYHALRLGELIREDKSRRSAIKKELRKQGVVK